MHSLISKLDIISTENLFLCPHPYNIANDASHHNEHKLLAKFSDLDYN